MGIAVDLIIVAIVLATIITGYVKGLAKSVLKLVSFILAIIIVAIIYKPIGNAIIDNTDIDENIKTSLVQSLYKEESKDNSEKVEEVKEEKEEKDENFANQITESLSNTIKENTKEGITQVAEDTSKTIVYVITAIGLFIIVNFVLIIVSLIIGAITELPIIKQVDKIGGIAFGAIEGVLFIYIVLAFISLSSFVWADNAVVKAVAESCIGNFIYNNNFIINIFFSK